ncbi:MAG TPA: hypothetical protein PLE81_05820 [Brevundimonas sp.]|jgi:hypothetical protein|uniref:hypothetical protein n=1 Tax=Brevundimonas sp. TaxID=1871086 RepID=UPI002CE02881|nr:hypothetical protein [Brevundimonas sp.]HRH20141.1 hypothetical protein [Brevundimonas sp.]
MSDVTRPISDMVRSGWIIENYSAALGSYGVLEHCFHMTRSSARKVVTVRARLMGSGVEVTELEI